MHGLSFLGHNTQDPVVQSVVKYHILGVVKHTQQMSLEIIAVFSVRRAFDCLDDG